MGTNNLVYYSLSFSLCWDVFAAVVIVADRKEADKSCKVLSGSILLHLMLFAAPSLLLILDTKCTQPDFAPNFFSFF